MPGDNREFGTGPADSRLTLFESIQEAVGKQPFRYWDDGEPIELPLHLMLFDPEDGCYHAFLKESPEEPSQEGLAAVSLALDAHGAKLPIGSMEDWVAHNLSDTGAAGLLKELLKALDEREGGSFQLPDQLRRTNTAREVLSQLLSALPSRFDWDVCGFYHVEWPKPDKCRSDPKKDQPKGTVWGQSSDGNLMRYHIAQALSAITDNQSRDLAFSYPSFVELVKALDPNPVVMELDQCPHTPVDDPFYLAYSGVYDALRKCLYPRSSWNWLYYEPLTVFQLFIGVLFVDFSSLVNIRPGAFATSVRDFRLEKHRDLLPAVGRLRLLAFDREVYESLGRATERSALARATAKHINHLFPVTDCLLEKFEPTYRAWSWSWAAGSKEPSRSFDEAHENAEPEAEGNAVVLTAEGLEPGLDVHLVASEAGSTLRLRAWTREIGALDLTKAWHASYLDAFRTHRRQLVLQKVEGLAGRLVDSIRERERDVDREVQHTMQRTVGQLRNDFIAFQQLLDPWLKSQSIDTVSLARAHEACLRALMGFFLVRKVLDNGAHTAGWLSSPGISLSWADIIRISYLHAACQVGSLREGLTSSGLCRDATLQLWELVLGHLEEWRPTTSSSDELKPPHWCPLNSELLSALDGRTAKDLFVATRNLDAPLMWDSPRLGNVYLALVEIARNGFRYGTSHLYAESDDGRLRLTSTNGCSGFLQDLTKQERSGSGAPSERGGLGSGQGLSTISAALERAGFECFAWHSHEPHGVKWRKHFGHVLKEMRG